MNYRREIDGLRALAVLPVILFHAGVEQFHGGFVGVDIFFVISGYLITTIIISDLQLGRFSITTFYERRARRILPALFFVIFTCLPLSWALLMPSDMKDFAESVAAVPIFASNILFWRQSGYFDTAAELKPLLHTWSLAVEEQYYVIFPLLIHLLWKINKQMIPMALAFAFALSLIAAEVGAHLKPSAAFYLLPTRGWELLVGALTAIHFQKARESIRGKALIETGGWLGIALIVYSIIHHDKSTPFPGLNALAPTIGTALAILFSTAQTTSGKILGAKPLVGIGIISYSAYLWHQPIFAFARLTSPSEPSESLFAGLISLTLLLSYMSWRFIETPFRDKRKVTRKGVFIFAASGSALLITAGLTGRLIDEWPEIRFNNTQIAAIRSASASPKRQDCHFPQKEESLEMTACRYFSDNATVAVIGNSHSTELAYSLAEELRQYGNGVIQHSMSGCKHNYKVASEANSICGRWHRAVVESVINDQNIKQVVISYRNEDYLFDKTYRDSLVNLANELSSNERKVTIVLQAPIPIAHINRHFAMAMPDLSSSIRSRSLSEWRSLYPHASNVEREVNRNVKIVDPAELFCDQVNCFASLNGTALFFDDNHMSLAGARLIAKKLVQEIFRNTGAHASHRAADACCREGSPIGTTSQ